MKRLKKILLGIALLLLGGGMLIYWEIMKALNELKITDLDEEST